MKVTPRRRPKSPPPKPHRSPYLVITQNTLMRWLLLFMLIGLCGYLWFSDLLKISQITCQAEADQPCDSTVLAELNRYQGQPTFLVKTQELAQKIKAANPQYTQVTVVANLPNQLSASINYQLNSLNLLIATGSAALIIDPSLAVVTMENEPIPDLPQIISSKISGYTIGDTISDPTLIFAIDLTHQLSDRFIPVNFIEVVSPTLINASLTNHQLIVFTSTKDLSRQVTSLQLILSKATIPKEPRKIDLRFDKPVLIF